MALLVEMLAAIAVYVHAYTELFVLFLFLFFVDLFFRVFCFAPRPHPLPSPLPSLLPLHLLFSFCLGTPLLYVRLGKPLMLAAAKKKELIIR